MPVDTPHPQYRAHKSDWELIQDLLDGETAVKARSTAYLPRLYKQDDADYQKYLMRASLYAATSRTHQALVGFITKKDPEMADMPELDDFLNDADLCGNTFRKYAKTVVNGAAGSGWTCSIVDYDDEEKRPYVAFYRELDIINWRFKREGGRMFLSLLVVREAYEDPSPSDMFAPDLKFRYSVWQVIDKKVSVTTYIANEGTATTGALAAAPGTGPAADSGNWVSSGTRYPKRAGTPLSFIPCCFHVSEGDGKAIPRPPLLDLAHVNISHFRSSADLESGRFYCGQPTPYAIGFDTKDTLVLGATHAWTTDRTDAKVGYLEFTGGGLSSLEKALEHKEGQMAALGARLIELRTGKAEAFDTVQLRASAETSALAQLGNQCTESLSAVLQCAAWWTGKGERPADNQESHWIVLNKDFTSARLAPDELNALGQAFQAGNLSFDAYFFNLQRGECFPDEWTMEQEKAAMETTPPPQIKLATDAQKLEEERLAHEKTQSPPGTKEKPQPPVK